MNILCKNWDVGATVAAFYYVVKLWKIVMGNKSWYLSFTTIFEYHAFWCFLTILVKPQIAIEV